MQHVFKTNKEDYIKMIKETKDNEWTQKFKKDIINNCMMNFSIMSDEDINKVIIFLKEDLETIGMLNSDNGDKSFFIQTIIYKISTDKIEIKYVVCGNKFLDWCGRYEYKKVHYCNINENRMGIISKVKICNSYFKKGEINGY